MFKQYGWTQDGGDEIVYDVYDDPLKEWVESPDLVGSFLNRYNVFMLTFYRPSTTFIKLDMNGFIH